MSDILRDRRHHARLGIRLLVTYRVVVSGQQGQSVSVDLSAGGIRFVPDQRINVGDQVDVTLRLPGQSKQLTLSGEVMWVSPRPGDEMAMVNDDGSVAVRFLHVDPEDRQSLSDYVRRFSPQ